MKMDIYVCVLAQLSKRYIGGLKEYMGNWRPSSTFSNDFFSVSSKPILCILHILYLYVWGTNNSVFRRKRTLVAMATYSFYRRIGVF